MGSHCVDQASLKLSELYPCLYLLPRLGRKRAPISFSPSMQDTVGFLNTVALKFSLVYLLLSDWTSCIAEDNLELLILMLTPSAMLRGMCHYA